MDILEEAMRLRRQRRHLTTTIIVIINNNRRTNTVSRRTGIKVVSFIRI